MAVCTPLLQGLNQEWALVKRHHTEDLFGVQLCGNNAHIITKTAQLLQETMEIDFIDLNLGCPIDLIYREVIGVKHQIIMAKVPLKLFETLTK